MAQPPPKGQEVGLAIVTGKKMLPGGGALVTVVGEYVSATIHAETPLKAAYYVLNETIDLLTTKP